MMDNRTILYLSTLGVACIIILFAINLFPLFSQKKVETYLQYNGVRGMAIEHNHLLYTLNFEQQNALVSLLNQSVPAEVAPTNEKNEKINFNKIIVYLFDQPDVVITPLTYLDNHLVFSTPSWNKGSPLKEVSNGELKKLIPSTYDP